MLFDGIICHAQQSILLLHDFLENGAASSISKCGDMYSAARPTYLKVFNGG